MRILLVHTGGTIGSALNNQKQVREQNAKSVEAAKKTLLQAFEHSKSVFAKTTEIEVSDFAEEATTLSESMTPSKLSEIICHIREHNDSQKYNGIIVLHGTDSLAYTASLFSFLFCKTEIPIFLVSGNRPPQDPESNAVANFIAAVELISESIAPNVYVTYRNSDGKCRLFLASSIMQCANFSEDFTSASPHKAFVITQENKQHMFSLCHLYSQSRCDNEDILKQTDIANFTQLCDRVLQIRPYTGLDYSLYNHCFDKTSSDAYQAVVHGTYHSGTVSWPGLVLAEAARNYAAKSQIINEPALAETYAQISKTYQAEADAQAQSKQSIYHLAKMCKENAVPLYIAPSSLGADQYETMNVVKNNTEAEFLNMTTEAAYAKLITALSFGFTPEQLAVYMKTPINNEFVR